MSTTLIPTVFPLVNLIGLYFMKNSCTNKSTCEIPNYKKAIKMIVFILYAFLLFATIILRSDLIDVSRTSLYMYLPFTLIWLLLTVVYFVLPVFVSVATIHETNNCYDKCNKYMFHSILFLAYFTLVYLLLNIRVTQNWQVLNKHVSL